MQPLNVFLQRAKCGYDAYLSQTILLGFTVPKMVLHRSQFVGSVPEARALFLNAEKILNCSLKFSPPMYKRLLIQTSLFCLLLLLLVECREDDDGQPGICLPVSISEPGTSTVFFLYDRKKNLVREGTNYFYTTYTYDRNDRLVATESYSNGNCKIWTDTYSYKTEYVEVSRQVDPLSCIDDLHSDVKKFYHDHNNKIIKTTLERSGILMVTEYEREENNVIKKTVTFQNLNGQQWMKDIYEYEYDTNKSFYQYLPSYTYPEASSNNVTKMTINRYSADDELTGTSVYTFNYTYTNEGYALTWSDGNYSKTYEYNCR
jgi:hypothetical protein